MLADPLDFAGGILDADDARQFGQNAHRVGRHVDDGPARDVVDDDRQRAAIVQRGEVGNQACLRRLVVIRRHDQSRIGTDLFGMADQVDPLSRVV